MALSNEEILNAVAEKSVLELVELISAFEEKFNVSAAAVAVAATGGDAPAAAADARGGAGGRRSRRGKERSYGCLLSCHCRSCL